MEQRASRTRDALLARACGLDVAFSKVAQAGGRDVLMVKRFDRQRVADGYVRARMVSALALLGTEDNHRGRERWSYVLLAEELRRSSADAKADAQDSSAAWSSTR